MSTQLKSKSKKQKLDLPKKEAKSFHPSPLKQISKTRNNSLKKDKSKDECSDDTLSQTKICLDDSNKKNSNTSNKKFQEDNKQKRRRSSNKKKSEKTINLSIEEDITEEKALSVKKKDKKEKEKAKINSDDEGESKILYDLVDKKINKSQLIGKKRNRINKNEETVKEKKSIKKINELENLINKYSYEKILECLFKKEFNTKLELDQKLKEIVETDGKDTIFMMLKYLYEKIKNLEKEIEKKEKRNLSAQNTKNIKNNSIIDLTQNDTQEINLSDNENRRKEEKEKKFTKKEKSVSKKTKENKTKENKTNSKKKNPNPKNDIIEVKEIIEKKEEKKNCDVQKKKDKKEGKKKENEEKKENVKENKKEDVKIIEDSGFIVESDAVEELEEIINKKKSKEKKIKEKRFKKKEIKKGKQKEVNDYMVDLDKEIEIEDNTMELIEETENKKKDDKKVKSKKKEKSEKKMTKK